MEKGKFTLESRNKMRLAKLGKKNPMYNKRGQDSPLYGRQQPESVKKKISESRRGQKISEETRLKMSLAKKNMSDSTKEKMRLAKLGKKRVVDSKK